MATDLSPLVEAAAADPQSASVDGQSATARPMGDLIAADQYVAAKAAQSNKRRGLRFTKLLPSGAVSDQGGARVGSGNFGTGGGLV